MPYISKEKTFKCSHRIGCSFFFFLSLIFDKNKNTLDRLSYYSFMVRWCSEMSNVSGHISYWDIFMRVRCATINQYERHCTQEDQTVNGKFVAALWNDTWTVVKLVGRRTKEKVPRASRTSLSDVSADYSTELWIKAVSCDCMRTLQFWVIATSRNTSRRYVSCLLTHYHVTTSYSSRALQSIFLRPASALFSARFLSILFFTKRFFYIALRISISRNHASFLLQK